MAVTISQNGQKRQNCYSYEVLATVSDLLVLQLQPKLAICNKGTSM